MSGIPEFAPKGPELIYAAMADHVEARIRAGELPAGSRLPAERDLAAEYEVGYMTARRAAKELRERGLIVTVQGKGTFVVDPVPKPADDSSPER